MFHIVSFLLSFWGERILWILVFCLLINRGMNVCARGDILSSVLLFSVDYWFLFLMFEQATTSISSLKSLSFSNRGGRLTSQHLPLRLRVSCAVGSLTDCIFTFLLFYAYNTQPWQGTNFESVKMFYWKMLFDWHLVDMNVYILIQCSLPLTV